MGDDANLLLYVSSWILEIEVSQLNQLLELTYALGIVCRYVRAW